MHRYFSKNTQWIWVPDQAENAKNIFLCFRKTFYAEELSFCSMKITADSRYYLYINGDFIGQGPPRSWPLELTFDEYNITASMKPGRNSIAVLVHHFGTSTSQYIHGRGGLIAEAAGRGRKNENVITGTGSSWKVRIHSGYELSAQRINVSQPWVEKYNGRLFPETWRETGFDDSLWLSASVIGPEGTGPWKQLIPRDIPHLSYYDLYPRTIRSASFVRARGKGVHTDFRENFYPGDVSTEDKLHLGLLCTNIVSAAEQQGRITLMDRKWPAATERLRINGSEYTFPPGQNTVTAELSKGDNFFIFDISGAYQRLSADLHFDFPGDITFTAPAGKSGGTFITAGPFQKENIGNIVCTDGFTLDNTDKAYLRCLNAVRYRDLSAFEQWLKPIDENSIERDPVKTKCMKKETSDTISLTSDIFTMILPNHNDAEIPVRNGWDSEFIIDFGEEVSGYFYIETYLDSREEETAEIDCVFFEQLNASGPEIPHDLNNVMRIKPAAGFSAYRSLLRRGFRYVLLTVRGSGRLRIRTVKIIQSVYPAADIGTFRSSDWELNEIWEISKRTMRLCMEDTYVDCPGFEQAFWIGDARNDALINHSLFGAYDITKRSIRIAAKSLYRSDIPECHVPAGVSLVLTSWALLWMISCRELYEHTGDVAFMHEIYPALAETARAFISRINSEGLLEIAAWNMLDWAEMDTPFHGVVTHQNAALIKSLEAAAFIADLTGHKEDAESFLLRRDTLRKAFNTRLWDPRTEAFIDSIHADGTDSPVRSLQTQITALLWDCADQEKAAVLEGYMTAPPEHFVRIGTPFMSFFYFEQLSRMGEAGLVLKDIKKRWGEMLKYGATTCWETFPGFYKDRLTRSYCHAWSSAPVYFSAALILGVRPQLPGFQRIAVTPMIDLLERAEGTVPTPLGPVTVAWERVPERNNGSRNAKYQYEIRISIPEGADWEVNIREAPENYTLHVNGKRIDRI